MRIAPAEPRAPASQPAPAAPQTPPAGLAAGHADAHAPSTGFARLASQTLPALSVAGLLCFVTFYAKGGLNLAPMTTLELALTLGGAAAIAAAVVLAPAGRRAYGLWPTGLLLAFTALSAVSVVWSVQPDASWQDAGRLLAYSAVFGAAVALARALPERWGALLGGIAIAAVAVCGYALSTKVLPRALDATDPYARLRVPYDYWNATGLTAALGVIACLWLGARRAGHALLSALAYPATGLLLVTLMLAYSRGALVALAVGLALWFWLVPLRLRGAAVLLVGGLGAGAVIAWTFSRDALSHDEVALAARASAGRQLGVLLVAMLLALTLAGVTIGFATGRRPPSQRTRRRLGAVLVSLPAIAVLALAGMLAASHRGLTGSITHGVSSLTDPHAPVPSNTPGRLTAVGSVRARYWNEALQIFSAHPALGAGAATYGTARLRYRTETLDVAHAHGFAVQTLADLGVVGAAFALALLAAWLAAAARATRPLNRQWVKLAGSRWQWRRRRAPAPYSAERIGLLSMLCVVVVFGVHSFVDWTWYIPGDACVALLCAGWIAGRGPLRAPTAAGAGAADGEESLQDTLVLRPGEPSTDARPRRLPSLREVGALRASIAAAVLLAALLAAWAQWQPQRSVDASNEALALLARNPVAARAAAQTAVDRDPLSAQALFTLAAVEQGSGQSALARQTLQRAVREQPSNPQTWVALGEYDLQANDPQSALQELRAAIYLNPEAIAPESQIVEDPSLLDIRNAYLRALRASLANGGTQAR